MAIHTILTIYICATVASAPPIVATNWTWLGGSSSADQTASYGAVLGQPSAGIWPGAGYGHVMAVHPINNQVLIFGGQAPVQTSMFTVHHDTIGILHAHSLPQTT